MRRHSTREHQLPLRVAFLLSTGLVLHRFLGSLVSTLPRGGASITEYVGQQLGNYRLIQLLGQGNFSEVYLGTHLHLNTQAAIKVLHGQLANHDRAGFLTEARTLARLRHPHIIRVLDFGVEGTTPFLVMDYAPGGTLRQRHPKGTLLPLDTVVTYVTQVAEALQYAHQEKLIHRDIKPENMLLGRTNEVLLSDFGIAVIIQSSPQQQARNAAGTLAYMAPEQLQGKPRPASDQYALGVVVYEWLCGDCPFHGTFAELYSQHLSVSPPPLCERVPAIPAAVEHVVLKALAKDPKDRFASVQAFASALEEARKAESSGRTLFVFASDLPREHPVEAEHISDQLNVRSHNLPAHAAHPADWTRAGGGSSVCLPATLRGAPGDPCRHRRRRQNAPGSAGSH